ncbi:hypothetical protein ACMFMG_012162 [Clarireedia jacksonii]
MRTLPRASSENNLDTLSTRKTQHTRVRNQLSVQTKVGAVSFNFLSDQRSELTTGKGFLLVNLSNHLLMGSQDFGTGNPGVVSSHHRCPSLILLADVLSESERTLVLVGVLELTTGVDTNDTTLGTFDLVDLVHCLLILVGDDLVGSVHSLTILTSLETPLNVFGWGLLQVVIDMGESVLLDVGDTDVLVGVNITDSWDEFTSEDVDQSRFTGTVRTNDGNTGTKRTLEGDVGNLWLGGTWVLESHLVDTNDSLGLGLDTLKETWLGELELDLRSTKLVVGLGLWALLDEFPQVTSVSLELESLVVDDVLANVVQETGVVRNDDRCARRVLEIFLKPLDVLDIQMVGRFVQKENIWSLENGTAKSQLHLPSTRKSGDQVVDHIVGETELLQSRLDLLLGGLDTDLSQLLHGPGNGGLFGIGRVEIVLNEHSLNLTLLGETFDLFVVDGTHKSGLSGTVRSAKTISLATLQTEVSLIEKNLSTIGQVESTVAKILTLLVISFTLIFLLSTWRSTLSESIDHIFCVLVANDSSNVWLEVLDPADGVGNLLIDELTSYGGDVSEYWLELEGILVLAAKDVLEDIQDSGDVTSVGYFRDLSVSTNSTDTLEGVKSLLGLFTRLRISQVVVVLVESWHQLWQESSDNVRVLDQLAHVVNNDSRLSLDSGLTLVETTIQKRNHDGQSGLVNVSDESGSTK